MKKTAKFLFRIFISILIFVGLYFLSAWLLSKITIEKEYAENAGIPVYILSNGVHTDIVVPVNQTVFNWANFAKREHVLSKDTTTDFVGFGWGDKGFFMQTPTWADLTFKTAFKATFGLGASAMHVTFHKNLQENDKCKLLKLNQQQYIRLVEYIKQTFKEGQDKKAIHIPTNAVYGIHDAFYEAKGNYNLFQTCNTWANTSLKIAGQKACLWTPFDTGIFNQYK